MTENEETHMTISDAKKTWDKVQHPLIRKISQQTRRELPQPEKRPVKNQWSPSCVTVGHCPLPADQGQGRDTCRFCALPE